MTLEQIAKTNDIHISVAAEGLANLIERGPAAPEEGVTREQAVADLRKLAADTKVG